MMTIKKFSRLITLALVSGLFLVSGNLAGYAATPSNNIEAKSTLKKELLAGDITHSVEKINNKKFHVTRALLKTTPDHIWLYLTDYKKAPSVFTNLNKIRLIDRKDNKKKVEFQVSSLGGLMKFDYVLHITESAPHHIEWQRASGAFKSNEGFWILKPVMNGKYTLVTYGKYVDGGMFLPKMIVDRQLKGTMPNIVKNLRAQVDKDKRRIAQK